MQKNGLKICWMINEISVVNLSQSVKEIDQNFDCAYVRYLQFRLLVKRSFYK